MKFVNKSIALTDLSAMAEKMFARLVKAVVDVEQGVMIVDAGLHGNRSRGVDDPKVQELIRAIVLRLVTL